MNCVDYLELIELHIEGQLTPEQETLLQSHLAECDECRALLSAYEEIQAGVASLEAEPPERFASGVMYRIMKETDGAPAKKKRFAFGPITGIAAVAAALALLVGTGLVELPGWSDGMKSEATSADEGMVETSASDAADSEKAGSALTGAQVEEETSGESAMESQTVSDSNKASPSLDAALESAENLWDDWASASDSAAEAGEAFLAEAPADRAAAYSVYAELYGAVDLAAIPELDTLERSDGDPNCYFGTAAEILALVERYEADFDISCSVQSGYGDDDPACLVIVP